VFKRIIRLVVVSWIVSMVAGAIAAMQAKRRIGPTSDESADDMAASAIFAPLAYHSTAANLRGGTLELWYGGGVLDLRDATLAPEGATLMVKAVFGGGQILVPPDWRVVANVKGLGGIQDTRGVKGDAADAPTLTIEGMVFAGGFAVQSELDEGGEKFYDGMTAARRAVDDATHAATDAAAEAVDAAVDVASAADAVTADTLEVEADPEMTPAT
jgi:hypothetical protein